MGSDRRNSRTALIFSAAVVVAAASAVFALLFTGQDSGSQTADGTSEALNEQTREIVSPDSKSEPVAHVQIHIQPGWVRRIGGVAELDRKVYFGIADGGSVFDERCRSKERYDWLIKENGITFGRSMNVINGLDRNYQAVREDPSRAGYVDKEYLKSKLAKRVRESSDAFKQDMGGRLHVATHGHQNQYPEFMGIHRNESAGQGANAQRLPKNIDAAAEFAATALRLRYSDFDRPAFYEPINEPHWSYWTDPHLADWHTRARKIVHEQLPGIQVGGPCLPVAYFYRNEFKAFDGFKTFIDNTRCELDFYSFHVYDFLREVQGDFRGRVTSGLPLESVLDLVQNYTVNKYGKEIGIVVTEHGGYGARDLVGKLAKERFQETGFEWEMKRRSIEDFNLVSSVIANTLVFMDHPQTVRTLRIGVSRPPEAGRELAVTFNGKRYEVPLEACADRLTELEYASCKIVQLDPDDVTRENIVAVSFPDGKPGAVGAVVIRSGVSSSSD